MKKQERIFVIGHKNPDTDSICSAIAYADIKNRTTQSKRYIPKRAGQINEETRYVLNRFGVQPPAYLGNIGTQVKDMDIRHIEGVSGHMSDHIYFLWFFLIHFILLHYYPLFLYFSECHFFYCSSTLVRIKDHLQ